jgi:hypothetical protein
MRRLIAISLVLSIISSASATVQVFTDRAAWEAALGLPSGGGINTGFESDSPQLLFPGTVALNDFDLSIEGSPNTLNQITCCESTPPIVGHYLNGFITNGIDIGPQTVTFEFDQPLSGFGADFDQANNNGMGMLVNGTLVDFRTLLGPAATNMDFGFIGVVDTMTPITSATLQMTGGLPNQGEFFRMDNVSLAAVPEPTSLSLVFMGLIAMFGLCRAK